MVVPVMSSPEPRNGDMAWEEKQWDPDPPAPSVVEAEPSHPEPDLDPLKTQDPPSEEDSLEGTSTSHTLKISELNRLPTPVPRTEASPSPVSCLRHNLRPALIGHRKSA